MIVNIRRERCLRNLWSSKIQTNTSWSSQTRQQVPQELLPRPVWFWRDGCRVCSRDTAIAVPLLSGWGLESIRTLTSSLFTLESLNWVWMVWGQIQVRSDEQGWTREVVGALKWLNFVWGLHSNIHSDLGGNAVCSPMWHQFCQPLHHTEWRGHQQERKCQLIQLKQKAKNRKSIGPRRVCSYCLS